MDQIGKAIEEAYLLGLTQKQAEDLDLIFRDYMREYHFPISLPANDKLLKIKYFRKALRILTPEQLAIYRKKKLVNNSKKKIKESEGKEKLMTALNLKYKSVNFSEKQLQTLYNVHSSFKKNIVNLEDRHSEILDALGPTLSAEQNSELKNIFAVQLSKSEAQKIEKTKRQYRYLDLSEDQAREMSIVEENEKKRLKKNHYRGYDPYKIHVDFEQILSKKQFKSYQSNQENLRAKALISQIEEDTKKTQKFESLKELMNVQIEEILPVKCTIKKQLLNQASEEDILNINHLINNYEQEIQQRIKSCIIEHTNKYGSNLPNQLNLKIIENTLLSLNPSALILKSLDLNQNRFSSIEITQNQQAELDAVNLRLRDFFIHRFEKESKGSYASLITSINRNADKPKYQELYSLLLLEDKPLTNLEKVKKTLKSHNIEFF